MNAINHTETQTIDTATQEVAAPAQNLIVVPLSQLRASERNVRKIKQSIDPLAESIARVGLLQNLTVILARDGEHYEVVAGGRRLDALKLLAKTRRIPKDWAVPCLLVADASARTVSLTENVQREAMYPADQFEAFAALVADYRADAVTLEQLMALAITDDHEAQEAAFYEAPEWQRQPHALRDRLTEREIDAGHALVRFVGLDAPVFEFWRIPGDKRLIHDGKRLVLLTHGRGYCVRLAFAPGLDDGMAYVYDIRACITTHPRYQVLIAELGKLTAGAVLVAAKPRPSPASLLELHTLQALDATLAGASLREIAEGLFGNDAVVTGWYTDGSLRSKVRRLVRRGKTLMNGGYRRLAQLESPGEGRSALTAKRP